MPKGIGETDTYRLVLGDNMIKGIDRRNCNRVKEVKGTQAGGGGGGGGARRYKKVGSKKEDKHIDAHENTHTHTHKEFCHDTITRQRFPVADQIGSVQGIDKGMMKCWRV